MELLGRKDDETVLSDTSVILRWERVVQSAGGDILFGSVPYRENSDFAILRPGMYVFSTYTRVLFHQEMKHGQVTIFFGMYLHSKNGQICELDGNTYVFSETRESQEETLNLTVYLEILHPCQGHVIFSYQNSLGVPVVLSTQASHLSVLRP